MLSGKPYSSPDQASRGNHELKALDAVIEVAPDRYLRGLEADFAHVVGELEHRSKRKRRTVPHHASRRH